VAHAVRRFEAIQRAFPRTAIHYAVKANPHPPLLAALAAAGCCFDVASPAEVAACVEAGAAPDRFVHSNPVARRRDLAHAAQLGVRLFVVDSPEEVGKLSEVVPGASVLLRLRTSGAGSDWPLSRKYGCEAHEAVTIAQWADRLHLDVAGLAFHVGSQQRDPSRWAAPIAESARVFRALERRGLRPRLLDLGGGLPARLEGEAPALATYGQAIEAQLAAAFGSSQPQTLLEPGRAVVGDAGVLVASVVSVVRRGDRRWVFLDAGVFTGLVETLDEAIRYRLETTASGPLVPAVLAGPTCDSADVLYERQPVMLPADLAEGDEVRFLAAGAYTTCYSTVGFNGFAPLPTVM
jgi:ornithine decarboxylase